jgi:hypothetical protein
LTSRLPELSASLLGALGVAVLICGATELIDDTNDQPILISNYEES